MAKFSKILSKTDTKKRLSVPTKFLRSLPPFNVGSHAVTFEATDERGEAWVFNGSIRGRGHPRPVLTKGWVAFIKSKKLKIGDKVRFFTYENQATATTCYEVRAEREIKLFGAIIGYEPVL